MYRIYTYMHSWRWWWYTLMMGVKHICTYNVCLLCPPTLLNYLEQVWHNYNGHRAFPLLVTMGHSDMPLQKDPQWRSGIYHDSYCSLAVAFMFVKDGNNGCILPILRDLFLIPTLSDQLKGTRQNWSAFHFKDICRYVVGSRGLTTSHGLVSLHHLLQGGKRLTNWGMTIPICRNWRSSMWSLSVLLRTDEKGTFQFLSAETLHHWQGYSWKWKRKAHTVHILIRLSNIISSGILLNVFCPVYPPSIFLDIFGLCSSKFCTPLQILKVTLAWTPDASYSIIR